MSVINREDTINYLMTNMNWHDEDGYIVDDADEKRAIITDLINGVPDADDGWIPVKDRLPEEDGQYLIAVKYKHVDGYEDIYAEHGEWSDGEWDMFSFGHCGEVESILAWRELPKPPRWCK